MTQAQALFKNLGTLTVSQLTDLIKTLLEGCFETVALDGEISGFKTSGPGHWYFTLKDDKSAIGAMVWASTAARLDYVPKNGDKVHVTGRLSVYEPRGTYSLVCSSIMPMGLGDILAQLEMRKKAYEAEGLFDASHKKPIPSHPAKVAVITALSGAALQDILQVLERRASNVDVIILPSAVQGQDAEAQLAQRIRQANEFLIADVIILGRGGGAVEDLLPFSADQVVRAVYESEIPIISAVGHEVDWALCDFASDLRAPTPSAAAELVSASSGDDLLALSKTKANLVSAMQARLARGRMDLDAVRIRPYGRRLESQLDGQMMMLSAKGEAISASLLAIARSREADLRLQAHRLADLSPLAVLNRGFAIVESQGRTIRSSKEAPRGARLDIRTRDGSFRAISEGESDEV